MEDSSTVVSLGILLATFTAPQTWAAFTATAEYLNCLAPLVAGGLRAFFTISESLPTTARTLYGSMVFDSAGNLYGTTVDELSPAPGGGWTTEQIPTLC